VIFFVAFISAALLSFIFTFGVKKVALRFSIIDLPSEKRKIHTKPTPLLGGVGIFLSFASVVLLVTFFTDDLLGGYLLPKHILGILFASTVLIVGGILDDKYSLRPRYQFLFPLVSAIIVIVSGIGISYISNPFGTAFDLETIKVHLFTINSLPYFFVLLADLFTILWLLGMTYTTKILDGLDGLVSGLTVIAGVVLFFLSMKEQIMQPETALLSLILAGSFFGFLFWNFYPAKIFLGEGGSTFAGFMIGTLSIISGGKLATALLIMSIPIIDLTFVLIERIWKKQSPVKTADTKHLHFRLKALGLSTRSIVLIIYSVSAILGVIALTFEGKTKIILFALFGVLIFCSLIFIARKTKKVA